MDRMSEASTRWSPSTMNIQQLNNTATTLFAGGKGLIAMDESNPTCNKRFDKLGIPATEEARRRYRELIVTAPGLNTSISGAIMFDETVRQKTLDGTSFVTVLQQQGIVPGIKVDEGAVNLPLHDKEKITEGLDGLRARLEEYAGLGMQFAKWRAVITIGEQIPSAACITANAVELALYAATCQQAGLVPIVEPEVLMDGDHTIERCREVTERVHRTVFEQLILQGVALEGLILKPNMVLAGSECPVQPSVDETSCATVETLLRTVPAAVPAVAFLSGGQTEQLASARLNAMNVRYRGRAPWAIAFSYSRAIQNPALEIWRGDDANLTKAQAALVFRASCNRLARLGQYSEDIEHSPSSF